LTAASDDFEDAANSERSEIVRAWLTEWPETERNILLMAYFEGFSQSAIVEQTGIPLGTVKTLMRIGMIKLSESLSLCNRDSHSNKTISETEFYSGFNFEQIKQDYLGPKQIRR
jgi:DNA-directed RNA polymerase specialized sigma24 family protein